jgi:hypothetical protein
MLEGIPQYNSWEEDNTEPTQINITSRARYSKQLTTLSYHLTDVPIESIRKQKK